MERIYKEGDLISRIEGNPDIFQICKGYLNRVHQEAIIVELRNILRVTPLFTPTMKDGTPFRYKMSNCGTYGWMADKKGYRYEKTHPNGETWLKMPIAVELACRLLVPQLDPQSCLINVYEQAQSLGLHQDNTEEVEAPIVSISLGAPALFYIGDATRHGKLHPYNLESGDVLIMSGKYRNFFHKVDSPVNDGPAFMKTGVRVNLTIRQVYPVK